MNPQVSFEQHSIGTQEATLNFKGVPTLHHLVKVVTARAGSRCCPPALSDL